MGEEGVGKGSLKKWSGGLISKVNRSDLDTRLHRPRDQAWSVRWLWLPFPFRRQVSAKGWSEGSSLVHLVSMPGHSLCAGQGQQQVRPVSDLEKVLMIGYAGWEALVCPGCSLIRTLELLLFLLILLIPHSVIKHQSFSVSLCLRGSLSQLTIQPHTREVRVSCEPTVSSVVFIFCVWWG